jgi:hypothetical protein
MDSPNDASQGESLDLAPEIDFAAWTIRECGFVDRAGVVHPPWDHETKRMRANGTSIRQLKAIIVVPRTVSCADLGLPVEFFETEETRF